MSPAPDTKLIEAIAFFEQMLDTMPDDRTGLEFLSVAYEQTGDVEKQVAMLSRLSEVLLKENELEHAAVIVERLKAFANYPQAVMAVKIAENIIGKGGVRTATAPTQDNAPLYFETQQNPETPSSVVQLDAQRGNVPGWISDATKAEMEIVWHWKDDGVLPKEICMDLLHVFMEYPISDAPSLVSAISLLDEQHPEYTTIAFEDLQRLSKLPPIPLELFEVLPATVGELPVEYVKVKGVIPFARVGAECLVGVLNPVSLALRKEIETITGRTCHFFLVHPAAWRELVDRLFPSL